MLSLFFVSLAVAISAGSVDHLLVPKKLFSNPKAFVKAFSHADKKTVDEILVMVDKLLGDGETDQAAAQALADEKLAAHTTADEQLTAAAGALETAKADVEVKTGSVADLTGQVTLHKATLDAATEARDTAQAAATKAADHKTKTIARVSEEKNDFDQILALLEEYNEVRVNFADTGRSLLEREFIMVDEDQIKIIRDKVNELIAVGQKEEEEAVDADDAAQETLTTATAAYTTAYDSHSKSTGQLESAKLAKSEGEVIQANKVSAHTAAIAKEAEADRALQDANLALKQETTRIDSEKATLLQVRGLLEQLNKE